MREELEKAAWESGFRVGHSSLLGYVDAAGEISAVPSSRHPVIAAAATAVETRATPSPLPPPAPALIPAPRRHTERMVPGARPPPRAKPPGWLMKVRKIESENWRVAQLRLRLGGLLQGNGERREGRLERRLASGAQTGAGEVVAGEAPERYASDSSSWGGAWASATGRR